MTAEEKWAALSESDRAALLERHRYDNTDHDWWDFVYESFQEDLKEMGIDVDQMYFSGFCSQGDGACFTGSVDNWTKFIHAFMKWDEAGNIKDPQALLDFIRGEDVGLNWSHNGSRYYHEQNIHFESAGLFVDNPYDEDSDTLRHVTWKAVHPEARLLEELEEPFCEFVKDLARDLYKSLEAEHDYLTDDEYVTTIITEHYEEEIDRLLAEQEEEIEG